MMMRTRLNEELIKLHNMLENMGDMIEQALEGSVAALANEDMDKAREIIRNDRLINRQEKDIESLCFKMILMEQPVAYDLRNVSAAIKMITDMERIGDQAADICDLILHIGKTSVALDYGHISRMAEVTIQMVKKSIEAFIKSDLDLAQKVCATDDEVDELFKSARHDLVELIRHDVNLSEQAIDMLMIAKYFERIGDHATNIGEWVIYAITGEHKDYNPSVSEDEER